MDVLASLEQARTAINVLEHPFYQRWNAGELSAQELASYAGEYRHAVIALAEASALAAGKARPEHEQGLRRHAEEEAAHVALWEQFARACDTEAAGARRERPRAQTTACAAAWTAGESLLEHLAVLYVIEAGQPAISRTKIAGLSAHYGYSAEGPATEYFRVHESRDVEHARAAAELIGELIGEAEHPGGERERMVRGATAALRGNWLLLDGVQA